MKGFAIGMVLIAVYVAVQDRTAARVEQAGGLFGRAVRRLMSPGVAGIPQKGGTGFAVGQAAAKTVTGTGFQAGAAVGGTLGGIGMQVGSAAGQAAQQVAGQIG